jgi:hypothetical protein
MASFGAASDEFSGKAPATHDIFISYRRNGGEDLAGQVKNALRDRGFSAFMDVVDLKSGKFDEALLRQIEEATDFVIILTPGCLDRCKNEDDWVRQEIRHSIQCKRNIVPVLQRDFQMPLPQELPQDIAELPRYNGLVPTDEVFETSMDRLVLNFLRAVPSGALLDHTVSGPMEGARFWRKATQQCGLRIEANNRTLPASGNRFYERRAIEEQFESFLKSKYSAMAIVGNSGMGKTTLVAHLASEYFREKNICVFVQSGQLSSSVEQMERDLIFALTGADTIDPLRFWGSISAEAVRTGKYLILLVDAVNEYNESSQAGDRPAHLMSRINRFVRRAYEQYPGIKVVITCRPETWNKGLEKFRDEFDSTSIGDAYFCGVRGVNLSRFHDDEFRGAYEKYRLARRIQSGYDDLSELARYHLRDPFLLDIASEAYEGLSIPRNLDTGQVFQLYLEARKLIGLTGTIDAIVSEMFAGGKPGSVQRVAISLDGSLHNRDLLKALDMNDQQSPGYRLKEANVLRKSDSTTGRLVVKKVVQFRFTYDRFAQYLLSNKLAEYIEQLADSGMSLAEAGVQVIQANLPGSQQMNVVFGALQRTLSLIGEHCSPAEYADVLRAIALIDARGLNLAISVLARVACSEDGLEVLRRLLKSLEPDEKNAGFPIIDAVYRILRDKEYRAWLSSHEKEQQKHLDLLYGYFQWGLCHENDHLSAVATQYMFYLWEEKDSLRDAVAATDLMVSKMQWLAVTVARPERRRLLMNLSGLMILLLAEISEPTRAELILDATRRGMAALGLKRSPLLGIINALNSLMGSYTVTMLKSLRNPINFHELEAFYANQDANLPDFECVMNFLIGDCSPSTLQTNLEHLILNRNSFVIQMLTFALSVAWELAKTPEDSALCLDMLSGMFDSGEPIAEYCSSLAMYHINFFGDRATKDTMELMARMAAHILSVRHGEFELGSTTYNFNIIGTYGRSLHKNGHLVKGAEGSSQAALQYAIVALKEAKRIQDERFYLYICENIGLLGVLIAPESVFTVITEILIDVGAAGRREDDRPREEPQSFSPAFLSKAKETVLQSLANIRVLYRQEVDRYLFDALESPELYDDVANQRVPEFRLATFFSWAFEQLMFRMLTKHRKEIGIDIVRVFQVGSRQATAGDCVKEGVAEILSLLREKSA